MRVAIIGAGNVGGALARACAALGHGVVVSARHPENAAKVAADVGGTVVKAFNTVFASRIADPVVDGIPLDGFYAGDDEAAKGAVAELLAAIGFRPLDVGGLPPGPGARADPGGGLRRPAPAPADPPRHRRHPGRVLLSRALEADLLVVGARGHGGFEGLQVGSVTEQCVRHAAARSSSPAPPR